MRHSLIVFAALLLSGFNASAIPAMDQLDIQCDVGGVYDPEKRRFDHHQKTFTTHWWEEKDKAAAGGAAGVDAPPGKK